MKFYDTCSLLNGYDQIFDGDKFIISNVTLKELENIKTSASKSEDIRYRARKVTRLIDETDKAIVLNYNKGFDKFLPEAFPNAKDDARIIASALYVKELVTDLVFVSEDICCKNLAKSCGLNVESVGQVKEEEYTGWKVKTVTEEELAELYNPTSKEIIDNLFDGILTNEYLLVRLSDNGEPEDGFKRTADGTVKRIRQTGITFKKTLFSAPLDDFKPYDIYQQCALDSLFSTQITVLRGMAGTAKSLLGLTYGLYLYAKGEVDQIIMFLNTVAVADTNTYGYTPGSLLQKVLDSTAGNFLVSKLTEEGTYQLIERGVLKLIPMADIRGYQTPPRSYLYITEAQNTSSEIMKLCLQRVSDAKVVIEGDSNYQVDKNGYKGANNGLNRLSEVFRGENVYSEVTLKNCYRSEIANIASKM